MIEISDYVEEDQDCISFNIKGITLAESNALRRSLIRRIPVMQIADVNTHIEFRSLPKYYTREKFTSRLRQVPFLVDSFYFQSCDQGINTILDEFHCLKYRLYQEYKHPVNEKGEKIKYISDNCPKKRVLTSAIEWIPLSKEQHDSLIDYHLKNLPEINMEKLCKPLYDDIILTLLNPGEVIDVSFYLTAGTKAGQQHVSFSAVNTVSAPEISHVKLIQPITDIEDAEFLIQLCPQNVFGATNDLIAIRKNQNNHDIKQIEMQEIKNNMDIDHVGTNLVTIINSDKCSHCQQCKKFSDYINIKSLSNQFRFTIETHGSIPVKKLFGYACDVIISKTKEMLQQIPTES